MHGFAHFGHDVSIVLVLRSQGGVDGRVRAIPDIGTGNQTIGQIHVFAGTGVVGDDHAAQAQFAAQEAGQKVIVSAAPVSAPAVKAGHNAPSAAIGECNFSDHGANRLGASALMQGLADGYFVLPYTIQNYLADQITVPRFSTDLPEFAEAEKAVQAKIDKFMSIQGKESVDSIHKKLGHVMWEYVGMGRTAEGLKKGIAELKEIRKEFETNLFIPGSKEGMNVELDKAIRLYDFITMGELVAYDALNRNESCGGHFREEYQTEEGEAKRDDENFFYVACWEYQGDDEKAPVLHKEPLVYEAIKVQTRNYKS